jgi:hypothetical protein
MEQQKKPAEKKPAGLNLTVKTLEKKTAPLAVRSATCPVIGYS